MPLCKCLITNHFAKSVRFLLAFGVLETCTLKYICLRIWNIRSWFHWSVAIYICLRIWNFRDTYYTCANMEKSLKRRWQLLRLLKLYLEKMMKFSGENYSILEFWSWLLYIWRYVTFDITYIKSWTWDRRRKTWTTLSISKFCS